jgi:hypothetical protein
MDVRRQISERYREIQQLGRNTSAKLDFLAVLPLLIGTTAAAAVFAMDVPVNAEMVQTGMYKLFQISFLYGTFMGATGAAIITLPRPIERRLGLLTALFIMSFGAEIAAHRYAKKKGWLPPSIPPDSAVLMVEEIRSVPDRDTQQRARDATSGAGSADSKAKSTDSSRSAAGQLGQTLAALPLVPNSSGQATSDPRAKGGC